MQTPPKVMRLIRKGIELGVADDMIFKTKNSKHSGGHFGLMTDNAVTRSAMYRDGVISALSRFIHPEVYE
jgi:non-canonical (house-cleaning) NTP pyrophosphatase